MKVLCITGTRADFGIYRPILAEMQNDPEIKLKLVVTGMHLYAEYGQTIDEIASEKYDIVATPPILFKGDSTLAMAQSIGMATLYFSDVLHFQKPDVVLLLGDRGEMLAAALAAHYQNIGIVHLHGGEISGSADDAVRHCISMLAHLHFVSCLDAKRLLEQFGEQAWRIKAIGSLRKSEIDEMKRIDPNEAEQLNQTYRLDEKRQTILFAMHPDSKDTLSFEQQITEAVASLSKFTEQRIVMIGPNSDAGGALFLQKMQSFASSHPHAAIYSSVPSQHYLYLLSQVDVLVGNSSSGIIEAPFFQLPFVHIGERQKNRTQGDNVVHVPYDRELITQAIRKQLTAPRKRLNDNPYDLGVIPEKEMLTQLKLLTKRNDLLQKSIQSFSRDADRS